MRFWSVFSFLHQPDMLFHALVDPPVRLTDVCPIAVGTGYFIDAWGFIGDLLVWCREYVIDFSIFVEYGLFVVFLRILLIFFVVPLMYGRVIFFVDSYSSACIAGCFCWHEFGVLCTLFAVKLLWICWTRYSCYVDRWEG